MEGPIEHDDTTSDDDEANDNSELPQTDVLVRSIGAVEVVQYYDESSFEVAGNIKQPSREDLRRECVRRGIDASATDSKTTITGYINVLKNNQLILNKMSLPTCHVHLMACFRRLKVSSGLRSVNITASIEPVAPRLILIGAEE